MHGFSVLLLASLLLSSPAFATTAFVDTTFDRSAWEAAAGSVTTDPFDNDIAQSDVLDFDSGIQSVAQGSKDSPEHYVLGGVFSGTLRTSIATASGYLTFTWDFGEPVTAFGADFFSITGGGRVTSVQGTFDAGLEAFDLRTLFEGDGGVDQGFFGLTSAVPFTSITLILLGTIDRNDSFTVDNVAFAPEPGRTASAAALLLLAGLGLWFGRATRRRAVVPLRGGRRGAGRAG